MNDAKNADRNAFPTRSGTRTERSYAGAGAREPLLSTEVPTSSLSAAQGGRRAEEASLTARIRDLSEIDALTRLVVSIRPHWTVLAVRRAIERDDRPWAVVVEACWRGASDPEIAHPNGLRYVGASHDQEIPRLPSVSEALDLELCQHESRVGACPWCRGGVA